MTVNENFKAIEKIYCANCINCKTKKEKGVRIIWCEKKNFGLKTNLKREIRLYKNILNYPKSGKCDCYDQAGDDNDNAETLLEIFYSLCSEWCGITLNKFANDLGIKDDIILSCDGVLHDRKSDKR